jgi:predicted AlkP superfamily phosphohydrolase/phosphomutase
MSIKRPDRAVLHRSSYAERLPWAVILILLLTWSAADGEADRRVRTLQREALEAEAASLLPAKREAGSPSSGLPGARRVLILGFDGLTYRILDPLVERGVVPAFAQLLRQGTRVNLESVSFPSSASAWPALVTGCPPEDTGMQSFFVLDPATYQLNLTNSAYRQRLAFWELASRAGRRSVVVNVPMTWPPDEVNGVMVSGVLSPQGDSKAKSYTWPENLAGVLDRLGYLTSYRHLRRSKTFGQTAFDREEVPYDVNDLLDIALNRFTLSSWLLDKVDWDLAMVVFTVTDRLQHHQQVLGRELIEHSTRQMDTLLGAFLRKLPEDTALLIVSDHGFRPFEQVFFLVPWLVQEGFLVLSEGKPDWSRSTLVPIDRVGCHATLRWNVKGREAHGVVTSDARKAGSRQFQRLEAALRRLEDVKGRPLVREVLPLKTDDLGRGGGPEILIRLREDCLVNGDIVSLEQVVSALPAPVYDHESTGVGIYYAPEVFRAGFRGDGSLLDIAPTALWLNGLPVPEGIAGQVPTAAVEPAFLREHPVVRESIPLERRTTEDKPLVDPGVKEQLKGLGYLGGGS